MPEVDQSKEVKVEKVQEVEVEGKVEEEVSEDWLDVLGSGDLKKKVNHWNISFLFVCLSLVCFMCRNSVLLEI